MMKSTWKKVTLGCAALVCASATQAFAGIDLELVGEKEGGSFALSFVAKGNDASTPVSSSFNKIKAFLGGPVTFTVTAGTFQITNAGNFEDDPGYPHDGMDGFVHSATGTANGWATTVFTPGPTTASYMEATGTTVGATAGPLQSLAFDVWWDHELTDGAHVFLEFWNSDTFVTGWEVKRKNGSTVSATAIGSEFVNYTTPIPLPPAVWSGLGVLGGMGFLLARKRRNRTLA